MKKASFNHEQMNLLAEKGVYLTVYNNPLEIERRVNREIFYDEDCKVGSRVGLWGNGEIFPMSFGSYSYSHSPLNSSFIIGNYCSIAEGLGVLGARHPMERFTTSPISCDGGTPMFQRNDFKMRKTFAPPPPWDNEIKIEDDVWIGANVTLKMGITLHTGCVVGAKSLVTHDVPPYAVVGGVPARIIRYRFDTYIIKKLLDIKWFYYDVNYLDTEADIYVYDFIKLFTESKSILPKLNTKRLDEIINQVMKGCRHEDTGA